VPGHRRRCDPPDFATASGIFNPSGKQHGLRNPDGPMAGDLRNLVVGPSGLSNYNTAAARVKLEPGEQAALLKPGGTSLVIYAQTDDDRTQPEGGAGPRIACGVIVAGPSGVLSRHRPRLPRNRRRPAVPAGRTPWRRCSSPSAASS
jgi:Cu/Zn superoxide dismutase